MTKNFKQKFYKKITLEEKDSLNSLKKSKIKK
jgi:hypothetical protein